MEEKHKCSGCGYENPGCICEAPSLSDSSLSDLLYANKRLLGALQMAYRKHHCGDEAIGWEELSDAMCDALCEAMGDEGFQKWVGSI